MQNNASAGSPQCTFLGLEMGRKCLCLLLGVGKDRLARALAMNPDCRYGKNKGGSKAATHSVDAFLAML